MTHPAAHPGSEMFLKRALHFAGRDRSIKSHKLQFPVTWLGYFIAYRAGMTVDAIAGVIDRDRAYVSRRLLAIMSMLDRPTVRQRIEGLVGEMGRIHFDGGAAEMLSFPGPSILSQRRLVS